MRGATDNVIHPAKLPANTSPSTWTRCAANWAVIELERLIGNLEAFVRHRAQTSSHTSSRHESAAAPRLFRVPPRMRLSPLHPALLHLHVSHNRPHQR